MRTPAAGLMTGLALLIALAPGTGRALEEKKGEKEALKACETRTCSLISRKGAGGDLACSIGRTWKQDSIKAGFGARVAWRWGDAQCSANISIPGAILAEGLTKPETKIALPLHTVTCLLEKEKELIPVNITLAPTLQMKDGRARKVWINVKSVDGPGVIRSAILTTARLEDSVGIFHGDIIKAVNKFIDRCAAWRP